MLLTLLSSLFGLFGSALPKIFDVYQDKQDKRHELSIMQMQMEMQANGHMQRLEEINTQADISMQAEAYRFAARRDTGVKWIDAFLEWYSGIVRPSITFALVGLYAAVKWASYLGMVDAGFAGASALVQLWSQEDMALLMGVISFWFGQRAFNYKK